ncbi:MAG: hypothetical protein KUF74_00995 [Candidatus Thiodiazotropha sp. (ex Ctena orbiculata)]|nr:hypothetical protein [Candidatus Thiodiazotropha taylori]
MSRIVTRAVKIAAVFSLFCLTLSAAHAGSAYEGCTLFNQSCFLCHGTGGKGDGPLAD